jgi:hypothetical protein
MPNDGTSKTPPAPGWRDLAEKASLELDPEKLISITSELLKKLDELERQKLDEVEQKRKALAQATAKPKSDGQS